MMLAFLLVEHGFDELVLGGVPGDDIDAVFGGEEAHEAEAAFGHVITEDSVDGVAVVPGVGAVEGRDSTLVAAEDEGEVGVLAKEFIPELLAAVAKVTVDFDPAHAALRIGVVTFGGLRLVDDAKIHVRGDDGAAFGVLGEELIRPCEHVVGRVALEAEMDEVEAARAEELSAVHVVCGDVLVGAVVPVAAEIPGISFEARCRKSLLKQMRVTFARHVVIADG